MTKQFISAVCWKQSWSLSFKSSDGYFKGDLKYNDHSYCALTTETQFDTDHTCLICRRAGGQVKWYTITSTRDFSQQPSVHNFSFQSVGRTCDLTSSAVYKEDNHQISAGKRESVQIKWKPLLPFQTEELILITSAMIRIGKGRPK